MSSLTLRFRLDERGLIIARHLSPETTSVVLTTVVSRADAVGGRLGGGAALLWGELVGDLKGALEQLNAAIAPALVPADPTPPAALVAWIDPDTLRDPRALNPFIDAMVGSFEARLEGQAQSPVRDARQRDAEAVHDALFPDGKRFLTHSDALQWRAVQARFAALPDEHRARLERLGLAEDAARIAEVNAWFGQLIGVTHDASAPADASPSSAPPATSLLDAAMARAQVALRRLLGFASALPDDDAHAEVVALLLEPYLEPVRQRARAASRVARAAHERAQSGVMDATAE